MSVFSIFFLDLQISGDYFLKTAALFYQTVCYKLKELTRRAVSTHLHVFKNKALALVKLKQTYLATFFEMYPG